MTAATSRTPSPSTANATPSMSLASRGPSGAGADFAALLARQPEPGPPGTPRLGDTPARQRAAARAADAASEPRLQPAPAARDEAPSPLPAKAPVAQAARAPAAPAREAAAPESRTRESAAPSDAPRAGPSEDAGDPQDTRSSESEAEAQRPEARAGDAVLAAWLQWPGAARTEAFEAATGREPDAALVGQEPGLQAGSPTGTTDALQAQAASEAGAFSTLVDAQTSTIDGAFAATWLGAADAGLRSTANRQGASSSETPHTAALAGLGATALPAPAGGPMAHTASAPSIPLGTAPGQPDFAETVSMHLSQLAQDGKHEATLMLNPAELGSIAVRIALDGNQTQVDFSASSASTRELLQTHLGELARALQNAGLQMTGGGVRDQSKGQASDGRAAGAGRTRVGGVESGPPMSDTRVNVPVAMAGRLDLFA